jgi:AcrR family transcriptional regulator
MITETVSRRAAGTEFLKECIADALLKLMKEKPFDKITVQEITDLANVGRATYFRQFSSKDDVLIYKIRVLWRRWAEKHSLNRKSIYTKENLATFFEFIRSISEISAALVSAEKINVIIIGLGMELGLHEPDTPGELYRYRYISYGIAGVLTEWIKRGYAESPAEMIAYLESSGFSE